MKYYNDSFNIEPNYDLPFFALTSSSRDFELLKSAFIELLDIMKYVLLETKKECETIKQQYDARTN